MWCLMQLLKLDPLFVLFTYPKLFHQQIFSLYGYPQIHCPRSFHDFVPPSMVQLQLGNNVFSCTSCFLSPARSPFTYPSSFKKTCHTPHAFPQKRLLFKLLREGKYKNGNFIIFLISNPEYVYLLYISFWHLGPLSGQEKAPENTKNMTPKLGFVRRTMHGQQNSSHMRSED